MNQFRIITETTELPNGTRLTITPGEVKDGELAAIQAGDDGNIIVGRWFPNIGGCNWIVRPGCLIRDRGNVPLRVLGAVS